jgi:hypothetical protein
LPRLASNYDPLSLSLPSSRIRGVTQKCLALIQVLLKELFTELIWEL